MNFDTGTCTTAIEFSSITTAFLFPEVDNLIVNNNSKH